MHSFFVSIATFLRVSPACVMEWLFLVLPLFFAEHFHLITSELSAVGNLTVTNWLPHWIFGCEPVCPSWHWLLELSLVTQHEIYSLWAWWSQILYAGDAITSEDQSTSNQALPYHEIKRHPSVQHVPGLQAVWDLVRDSAQYIRIW